MTLFKFEKFLKITYKLKRNVIEVSSFRTYNRFVKKTKHKLVIYLFYSLKIKRNVFSFSQSKIKFQIQRFLENYLSSLSYVSLKFQKVQMFAKASDNFYQQLKKIYSLQCSHVFLYTSIVLVLY